MRTGEGFVCVYSVTSRSSFEEMSAFHQQILRVKDSDLFPVILVANKCDLIQERTVSRQEGLDLAQKFDCRLLETSAKMRINVDECFYGLVQEVRIYNLDSPVPKHHAASVKAKIQKEMPNFVVTKPFVF